jgi:DNA-binding transcriptional ArsR family regulator
MSSTLDEIFSALSDTTRRQILIMLLEDDMAVTDVADPFDMSLPAISKHLNILSKGRSHYTRKARKGKLVQIGARWSTPR